MFVFVCPSIFFEKASNLSFTWLILLLIVNAIRIFELKEINLKGIAIRLNIFSWIFFIVFLLGGQNSVNVK